MITIICKGGRLTLENWCAFFAAMLSRPRLAWLHPALPQVRVLRIARPAGAHLLADVREVLDIV